MSTLDKPEFLKLLDKAVTTYGESKHLDGVQEAVDAAREAGLPAWSGQDPDCEYPSEVWCPITSAVIQLNFQANEPEIVTDAKEGAWQHYLADVARREEAPRIYANMRAFGW